MNWKNSSLDYEQFIDNILNAIGHIKFWKKNSTLSRTKNLINIFLNIILLTLSSLLVISETIAIKNSYDLTSFAANLNPVLFHSIGLFKWIFMIIKMNDIEDILVRMKRCHRICLTYNETEKDFYQYITKLMNYKDKMMKFTRIWFFICLSGVVQWCLNPVVYDYYNIHIVKVTDENYTRNLPYPGTYPWIIDSNYKYILTFVFQLTSALTTSIEMATSDILNVIFLVNISLNLQLLNESLVKEKDNLIILRSANRELPAQKFKKKLRNCLLHHREILLFVSKFKIVSSYSVFLLCFDSTVALCLISLEVSMIEINSSIECIMKLMSMAEYWSGVTVELFLFSFLATRIEELGLKTADAIYACNWEQPMVNYQAEFRGEHRRTTIQINQMIKFGVMCAQKPIIFNGGLFYILSVQTFKAVSLNLV
ncbi:uncharacterized protein LOC141529855 [Cotesia typhae]|uniref:uncharacterized protein LOC141529855 n=1 Tax=Cotesia typhae TaxID=2053667 RepID=UPI003D68F821